MTKTQRVFSDVETGFKWSLYQDETDNFHLIMDEPQGYSAPSIGSEVNGFYICAHTACTIRLNTKTDVELPTGTFYNMKEGEKITHKKFIGFKRFTKVND